MALLPLWPPDGVPTQTDNFRQPCMQSRGDMEDDLGSATSPHAPHLQLCHLTASKPIPQVSLMGVIRCQRRGPK